MLLFWNRESGMEGGRKYFRDTIPISIFLGISRYLDVAVVAAYLSLCGRRVEAFLGSKLGFY